MYHTRTIVYLTLCVALGYLCIRAEIMVLGVRSRPLNVPHLMSNEPSHDKKRFGVAIQQG